MGEEICAVFTHEDAPHENIWFGSVKETANQLGIPTYWPQNPNTPEWIQKIKDLKPDALFSFYYRHLLGEEILGIPRKGSFNLHGSLLPKYRGRAPVNWVLVNGESKTGLTLHHMVKKADAGDIVAQETVSITPEDTALTLYRKLVPLTGKILLAALPQIANGTAPKIAQDSSVATTFAGRKPEDGKIDWTKPSKEIYNLVRAVTHPYPGAFTFLKGKKVLIWQAQTTEKISGTESKEPGSILFKDPLIVVCGRETLELKQLQSEGQKEMDAVNWIEANAIESGIILGESKT